MMRAFTAVLRKLVHQVTVPTLRVVVATPIMAHLVPHHQCLLISNERVSPTLETTEASVVDDSLAPAGLPEAYRGINRNDEWIR